MKKVKIIEEGRLTNSEMDNLMGGVNGEYGTVCQGPEEGYRAGDIIGICDFEVGKVMTPGICNSTPGLSYGCQVFGRPGGGGSGVCGGRLGIVPNI